MASTQQVTSLRLVNVCCCICTDPVPLEISKTNEWGEAVHEDCYVAKIVSNFARAASSQRTVADFQSFPQVSNSLTSEFSNNTAFAPNSR